MLGQSINVASYNLADEGGSMRKKRLFEFSLIIALSASFITLQINPARIASAQDPKVKMDGFITGCSETVIDALDECIQERFSKADPLFGIDRVAPPSYHVSHFIAETQGERDAISELERGGWQVAFYLAGRRMLGPKPVMTNPAPFYLDYNYQIINGPIAITPSIISDERERGRAPDYRLGSIVTASSVMRDQRDMIEQLELPEPLKIWDDAQKAMREFEKKDQYDFSFGKWSVAARPIRAKESCLKCHTGNARNAPGLTSPKAGDALGVAMYAYARKQKGASTLIR
jgi:hypothetical protein